MTVYVMLVNYARLVQLPRRNVCMTPPSPRPPLSCTHAPVEMSDMTRHSSKAGSARASGSPTLSNGATNGTADSGGDVGYDYTENAPQAVVDAIAIERAREEKEGPPDMMVGSWASWMSHDDGEVMPAPDPES